MTIGEAREIAQEYLDASGRTYQGQRLLVDPDDELVKDFDWCYAFYYDTERFMETNDPSDSMGPGSGPLAVVKKDGAVHQEGSAPGYEERLTDWGSAHGYV